jgi:hypothetical protein
MENDGLIVAEGFSPSPDVGLEIESNVGLNCGDAFVLVVVLADELELNVRSGLGGRSNGHFVRRVA